MYRIPEDYYFRLHHVRPRFKSNIEDVLTFIASEISSMGELAPEQLHTRLNNVIRRYPGNAGSSQKTIDNWRTEIISLFSFIQYREEGEIAVPGKIAELLAENLNLTEFFRLFLWSFQYPGSFLAPDKLRDFIHEEINFKPAKSLLALLDHGSNSGDTSFGISKAEATHCIFNDLRYTKLGEDIALAYEQIMENRETNTDYDTQGDVIRYAGDILDYMELADLVICRPDNRFYLRRANMPAILRFIESDNRFDGYDYINGNLETLLSDYQSIRSGWFDYVNNFVDSIQFDTNVFDIEDLEPEQDEINATFRQLVHRQIQDEEDLTTTEIGNIGEAIAIMHEKERLRIAGREDLIHLVQKIPNHFASGYDISSRNTDGSPRHIEVKTTFSRSQINSFSVTKNEWNSANSLRESYLIYRVFLRVSDLPTLFIITDPINKHCERSVNMELLTNGANIYLNNYDIAGNWEEILWVN